MNIAKNLTNVSSIFSIICSFGIIAATFLPYTANDGCNTLWAFSKMFANVDNLMLVEKMTFLIIGAAGLNILMKIFTANKWITVIASTLIILAHIVIISIADEHHIAGNSFEIGFIITAVCVGLMLISLFFSPDGVKAAPAIVKENQANIENDKEVNELREKITMLEQEEKAAAQNAIEEQLIDEAEIIVNEEDLIDSADVWVEESGIVNEEEDERTRFK